MLQGKPRVHDLGGGQRDGALDAGKKEGVVEIELTPEETTYGSPKNLYWSLRAKSGDDVFTVASGRIALSKD
jgi:hypothetical protein